MANREIDRKVYEEEINPWLPPVIFDCHVHVWLPKHVGPISRERYGENWAIEVCHRQSWEDLRDTYRALFPKQGVRVLAFGLPFRETDIERSNEYVFAGASDPDSRARPLFVTRPDWDAGRIGDAMARGFIGIKPYPDLARQGMAGSGIYDFLPPSHLSILNDLGGALLLHLPRPGRLADPDNIREVLEISENYPSIKMIIAHIGRSFCLPTARRGLPHFVGREAIYFDTSANLNPDVYQYALETIGPNRLLFGSDLPITLMRGVREHIGERYINYTDGPYSWNVNRKSPEEEARYTYFLYEELRALLKGIERAGMGSEAVEKIMYLNAAKLLAG